MSEGSGLGVCDEIPHGTRIPIEDLRFLGSIPVGNYLAKRKYICCVCDSMLLWEKTGLTFKDKNGSFPRAITVFLYLV